MTNYKCRSAVLFLVFNRPDVTNRVFQEIRKAQPPRLYVAADGPRSVCSGEVKKVNAVREIVTKVDWKCELITLFRDKNLGCAKAISEAITWFFNAEEMGIILEDDILPSRSFFRFCDELLEIYKNDERISIISGYNKQNQWLADSHDYFFSYFGGIWGWASWRRAWSYYDGDMKCLDKMITANVFKKQMGQRLGRMRELQLLSAKRQIASGDIDTWDYPWALSRHASAGIACVPSKSLTTNIGFGCEATHTKGKAPEIVEANELSFPITINSKIVPDREYDLLYINSKSLFKCIIKILMRKVNM